MFEFNQSEVQNWVDKAYGALDLDKRIVAMKFLFTQDEFDRTKAEKLDGKMSYCKMIFNAMTKGESVKADFDNFGCFGGARALGIVGIDEYYTSGRFFAPRGLYKDFATSHYVSERIARVPFQVKGIVIKPVEEFTTAPDVVLIATNPRKMMRLIQGYTYHFGTCETFKMIGNQAICAEATADPFNKNDVNISCLCAGPRSAGFSDEEMAMGIPFNKFDKLIDGLCKTITAVEHSDVKDQISARFEEKKIQDIPVIKGRSYNVPFFGRDIEYFTKQREETPMREEKTFPDIFDVEADQKNY